MKKRAQLPNVQTYTIIFRGLAKSQHPKLAVAEAMKHYNILMTDKRLKPNSIHLNAVLHVCARAGDLDSMFLIANTINEGERAPTSYTYTIILNALRHAELSHKTDLSDEQKQANLLETINRAKGLWRDVIQKWSKGKIVIDEELVCAMGRIILMSPEITGKREIFDLLEQTMRIPNLTKDTNVDAGSNTDSQKTAVASSKTGVYATPGRNTLALVLTLLATTRELTVGIKYWNLLVRDRGIVPDNDNWLRLFGMLKVARSSAHAASMVEIVPDELLESRHYRIAMEACLRDGLNQNVVKNANRILDSMVERFYIPDLHAMRQYLEVCLNSHAKFRAKAASGAVEEAKRDYGIQLTSALTRLWEPYKKAHYNYFKTATATGSKEDGKLYNMQREVFALARHMVSTFNKVINENMLPEKDLAEMKPVAAKINREIQAFYQNRESKEPNLHPTASDDSVGQGRPSREKVETGGALEDNDDISSNLKKGERGSRKDRNFTTQSEFSILPARPWVTYDRGEKDTKRWRSPQGGETESGGWKEHRGRGEKDTKRWRSPQGGEKESGGWKEHRGQGEKETRRWKGSQHSGNNRRPQRHST